MSVTKPIFVVGTGRCGSTVFHHVFSHHPQLSWLTKYCATHPHNLKLNRWALQSLDTFPFFSQYLRKLIYPVEAYQFWDYYCPGFSEPYRDLLAEDVLPSMKERLVHVLGEVMTLHRDRLLIKLTGWPRIGFIKAMFPDAKFIHVYRDGRAVAASLLNVSNSHYDFSP